MREAGVSITWIAEHVLKGPEDIPALAHLFSNLEVVRTYEQYGAWQEWVGESGLAVAYANSGASPLHHILHDLMEPMEFFLALHDYPEEFRALEEAMAPWFRAMHAALLDSPAEVIFIGRELRRDDHLPAVLRGAHSSVAGRAGGGGVRAGQTSAHPRRWRERAASAALTGGPAFTLPTRFARRR